MGNPETKTLRPKVKDIKDIDITPIIKICEEHLNEIEDGEEDTDTDHYIYEEVMTALYGVKVWDYMNSKLK